MPDIVSRTEWSAAHGRGAADPGPEPRVVIHHSFRPALAPTATPAEEAAAVRGIERFHVESNGWAGIGYNFLVAPSGRVYEGRGWQFRGAHAGPVNGDSIGICLLVDGNVTEPTRASIEAVRGLIRAGIAAGEITVDYHLSGHRDHMDRTCPGDLVYRRLSDFRHDADGAVPEVDPEVVGGGPAHPAADDRLILDPISVPLPEHLEQAAARLGVPAALLCGGAPAVEAVLRSVSAGSTGVRALLAGELQRALGGYRERHCGGDD